MSPSRDETTPGVLLAHHLKQLKLPTELREYDKVDRLREAAVAIRMAGLDRMRNGRSGWNPAYPLSEGNGQEQTFLAHPLTNLGKPSHSKTD